MQLVQTQTPLILLVEDDDNARAMYSNSLTRNGYRTLVAANGKDALALAKVHPPDLALLDIMMPGISGREVAVWLREHYPEVKIIFITALDSIEVAVDEMRQGTFHYLTKPVGPRRMLETVEMAWAACQASGHVQVGDMMINLRGGQATLAGEPLLLTALESKLLVCLAQRQGQETSYDELWREVWGYDDLLDKRVIHKALNRLREKIDRDRLVCVRGRGYLLQ